MNDLSISASVLGHKGGAVTASRITPEQRREWSRKGGLKRAANMKAGKAAGKIYKTGRLGPLLQPGPKVDGIAHGTISSYNNHKCRCAECRAAWAAYWRKRQGRMQIEDRFNEDLRFHDVNNYEMVWLTCVTCGATVLGNSIQGAQRLHHEWHLAQEGKNEDSSS